MNDAELAERSEMLQWYWDLINLSTEALGAQEFDDYAGYEDWRRDIKGGMLL